MWLLIPGLVLLIWYARLAAKGYAPGASPQMFWVEFCCVLSAILIGVRRGGVALGLIGGLGVSLLVLGFRTEPATPPIDVMLIILAVVTAAATLQVAGGLDYMVRVAERLLRANEWGYWLEGVEALERDWFAPLLAALRGGELNSLRLILSGQERIAEYSVGRNALRKFWLKPGLQRLAH